MNSAHITMITIYITLCLLIAMTIWITKSCWPLLALFATPSLTENVK